MEVEEKFVVDLENHFCAVVAVLEEFVDFDHGEFDHVRSRALDGGVDGGASGVVADGGVAGGDVAEVAAAA